MKNRIAILSAVVLLATSIKNVSAKDWDKPSFTYDQVRWFFNLQSEMEDEVIFELRRGSRDFYESGRLSSACISANFQDKDFKRLLDGGYLYEKNKQKYREWKKKYELIVSNCAEAIYKEHLSKLEMEKMAEAKRAEEKKRKRWFF